MKLGGSSVELHELEQLLKEDDLLKEGVPLLKARKFFSKLKESKENPTEQRGT